MALVLLSIVFLSFVFFIIRCTKWKCRLPVNLPLVGIVPALLINLRHFQDYITTLLIEARGTMVFRGPGSLGTQFLLTCDPANVNYITNLQFHNFPKGVEYSEIFDILGDGLFNCDGESWRAQRLMALAVFRDRQFLSSVVAVSEAKVEKSLLPLLDQLAESGNAFDLQDVMLRLTFDVIYDLILGTDPGSLSPGFPTIPFSRAIDEGQEGIFYRHLVPMAWWKLMRRLDVGMEKKMRMAWQVIDQVIAQSIKETRESNNSTKSSNVHTSILSSYMALQEGKEGYFGSDKFLRDSVLQFVAAGKDSNVIALSWFFWLVSQNPQVEAKILLDLKRETSTRGELVYLHASLCEAIRLYPPLPMNHKRALQSDVLPSGHKISGGTEIIFSMYSMGRMESIWGRDCLEFRPERWITEEGKLRHEPSSKFGAFGSGPRTCLGKDVAFVQMKIVAAALISNFHIEAVEGHVVEPKPSIILLYMKNGLMVRMTKRRDSIRKLM